MVQNVVIESETHDTAIASKEELQSLNRELVTLNHQLREMLDRQCSTSNDLRALLNSLHTATLFLDLDLNIRFFTSALRCPFDVILSDLGRPIADTALGSIDALVEDARQTLETRKPVEHDMEGHDGIWYSRRTALCCTQEDKIEGVAITFIDITDRKRVDEALKHTQTKMQMASLAKSELLATASHDLREPLQSLSLIQGMLTSSVSEPRALRLVDRFGEALEAMSDMLNAFLDVSEADPELSPLEAGSAVGCIETGDDVWNEEAEKTGTHDLILFIEADLNFRKSVNDLLQKEGYRVVVAEHGAAALAMIASKGVRPDFILVDYHLPGGMNGLEVKARLWQALHYEPPTVILVEDGTPSLLSNIELNKHRVHELPSLIRQHLEIRSPIQINGMATLPIPEATICVIDDNEVFGSLIGKFLVEKGYRVRLFTSAELFLAAAELGGDACLVVDAGLPGMSGPELIMRLRANGSTIPSIMIAGNCAVHLAVESMKAGAIDFLEKPFGHEDLLVCLRRALELSRDRRRQDALHDDALRHINTITPRQRQIMDMVLAGHPSKNIAADLGISQRTVENHRASIMKRTGATSLPELARLAVSAAAPELD